MTHLRAAAVVALASALSVLGACQNQLESQQPPRGPLREAFARASAQSGVPEDLLLAVGWVESRWQMADVATEAVVGVDEAGDHAHGRNAVGLMGVVDRADDPRLTAGSASLGMKPERARTDAAANIAVAAEILRQLAQQTSGGTPDHLNGWRQALALYGADGDPELGDSYADEVFETLARGARGIASTGASTGEELVLSGNGVSIGSAKVESALNADSALVDRTLDARTGFFTRGRGGTRIDRVLIHTTEGSYDGAISWFRSPNNPYKTSAHYVIRSSDGHTTQMVDESNTAHHVRSYNQRSIGIEHEAVSSQARWFTDAMYRASAALVRDICQRNNIPMDRAHIIGHNEAPGNDHSDPGRHWDWDRFMDLVNNGASQVAPPSSSVDSEDFCDGGMKYGKWCDGSDIVDCGPTGDRGFRSRTACSAGCQVMPSGTPDQCMTPPAPTTPPPPAPASDPCGGETFEGRCDGDSLVWCENQQVKTADCAARGLDCGYQDDSVGNNCVAAAPAPDPCGGETWAGRCDGDTLIWCEANAVQQATCNGTCGWQSEDVGNNCL